MGRLFEWDEVKQQPVAKKDGASVLKFSKPVKQILVKNRETLREKFGMLQQGENIMFCSGGRWSAHDVIFYVLIQTGPARIYLSTWAISERAAELFASGLSDGSIVELNCIFDRRLPARKEKTMQLARNVATKISLVDCHAKVTVIENDEWKVTIAGSANLSNNKRIEWGCVFTDEKIMEFNKKWILDQLNDGDPFNWKNDVRS